MSIAAPPPHGPPPRSVSSTATGTVKSVADKLIEARILEACKVLWWAEVVRNVLQLVMLTLGALIVWVIVDQWIYSAGLSLRISAFTGLFLGFLWYLSRRIIPLLGNSIRPEYAARSLERDMPELRQSLTSYVTLRSDRDAVGLRSRVVRSIGAETAGRLRAHDELPTEATGTIRWWVATAILLAALVAYAVVSPKNTLQSATRLVAPFASIDPARRVSIRDVQPGDVEAIAGRAIEVSALIDGMHSDEEAFCRWDLPSGRQEALLREDPDTKKYISKLWLPHSVSGEVVYLITAGDAKAGPFRLTVQDVPVVALQSVRYVPPKYTGQSPHTSSSGSINALDGTRVTILAATNRAVARARIEFNPRRLGQSIQATAGATEMEIDPSGTSLSVGFPLRSARGRSAAVELESYRIKIWDAADQSNPEPIIYPIRVVADLPPEVSIMMPFKSPQDVPIDAQQIIEVHASDPDFGLKRIALEIRSGIDLIDEPILWSDPEGAKGNRVTEYRFRPAKHGLRIGDTVQVVAVAIDNRSIEHDPSVEPNVTLTDPVELKITASEPLPKEGDPDAGGLSASDDRPASDHPTENQQSSDSDSGQEGQGQSGEGQSGEGQSGEGQSGEGQSGEGQSGEGQSGEGQSGEGQSGKGQSGQSDPQTSDSPTGNEGSSGKQGTASNDAAAGDSTTQQSDPNVSPGDGGQPNGNDSTDETTGKGGETKGGGSEAASRDASAEQGGSDGADNDGSGIDQETSGNERPKHDGEAFERIRDHLEQQRKEQQRSGGGSAAENQSGNSTDKQSGSSGNATTKSSGQTPETRSSDSGSRGTDSADAAEESSKKKTNDRSPQPPSDDGSEAPGQEHAASDSANEGTDTSQQGDGESGEQTQGSKGSQSPAVGEGKEQGASGDEQPSGEQAGTSGERSKPSDAASDKGSEEGQTENGQAASDSGKSRSSGSQSDKDRDRDRDRSSSEHEPSQSADNQSADNQTADNQTADNQSSGDQTSPSGKPNANRSSSQADSKDAAGSDSDGLGEAGDSPVPPDPVNVDYAKRATDMVLDYLEETRDEPDQQLLDKLKWTQDDLQRFGDRWQKVREMTPTSEPDASRNRDLEEALMSLGLRPPSEATDNVRDSADSLRAIRDAGNRKPPPATYRDAFDAFRRAVGRQ